MKANEYPKGYWPLLQYIQNETNELLRSEIVYQEDLLIWSQDVGTQVLDFYKASKDHSQIGKVYNEILKKVNLNHKKIKRRIVEPLIRTTSLDEVLDEGSLVGIE